MAGRAFCSGRSGDQERGVLGQEELNNIMRKPEMTFDMSSDEGVRLLMGQKAKTQINSEVDVQR